MRRLKSSDIVTASEIQTRLCVSESTAYRIMRQIGVRAGRRIIVTRRALDAWLADTPAARREREEAERTSRREALLNAIGSAS